MKERDIISNPILADIYDQLIDGWQYSNKPNTTKQQVLIIIKQLVLSKILFVSKIPQWLVLSANGDAEARLIKFLKKQYAQRGETPTDEEIKKAVDNIDSLMDMFVEQVLAQESKNA